MLLVGVTKGAVAQDGAKLEHLRPALGSPVGDFIDVTAIRELIDETVLVLQRRGEPLVRLDFRDGSELTVARRGSGPGEVRSTGRLVPLAGDSTLVPDGALRRWLVLVGHQVVETVTPDRGSGLGPWVGHFVGGDYRGSILALQLGRHDGAVALQGMADFVSVLRANRVTGVLDTLLRIDAGPKGIFEGMVELPVGPAHLVVVNPLSIDEQAIQFSDGWIAIAELGPYRVTWIRPDGHRTTGPPIPAERVPLDDREKQAAIDRSVRRLPGTRIRPDDFDHWPSEYPAFDRDALSATPEGRLVIHRMIHSRSRSERYDVIDRSGSLIRTIALPLGDRIAGFGRRFVYVVTTDADDMEHLQRHPWP